MDFKKLDEMYAEIIKDGFFAYQLGGREFIAEYGRQRQADQQRMEHIKDRITEDFRLATIASLRNAALEVDHTNSGDATRGGYFCASAKEWDSRMKQIDEIARVLVEVCDKVRLIDGDRISREIWDENLTFQSELRKDIARLANESEALLKCNEASVNHRQRHDKEIAELKSRIDAAVKSGTERLQQMWDAIEKLVVSRQNTWKAPESSEQITDVRESDPICCGCGCRPKRDGNPVAEVVTRVLGTLETRCGFFCEGCLSLANRHTEPTWRK